MEPALFRERDFLGAKERPGFLDAGRRGSGVPGVVDGGHGDHAERQGVQRPGHRDRAQVGIIGTCSATLGPEVAFLATQLIGKCFTAHYPLNILTAACVFSVEGGVIMRVGSFAVL